MPPNILVTGAGGYIGGSIVTEFLGLKEGLIKSAKIHAAVRSKDQAVSLANLNVAVIQMDLRDEKAVASYIISKEIDIIINTATSIDKYVMLSLIKGLSNRRLVTGKETYLVHTSGLSAFDEVTGWPYGTIKDTDSVYDMEKQTANSYIVRHVDTFIIDQLRNAGITGFIVMPPTIHGRGSGTWNQLSPQLPALIRASIQHNRVHKFAENRNLPVTHISDLTKFYAELIEAILQGKKLPTEKDAYFFVVSHVVPWWDILDRLAERLYARGLVTTAETKIWPSDEVLSEAVGVPAKWAYSMWNAGTDVICENKDIVGWQPVWDKDRFLASLDDEIDDFLELGLPKSSLLSSVRPGAGK
ncbi:uncharacterized protein N7484_002238 [Penicillium longicatenatum]|uniref:uncharacterized protein n=1 Tax=Penicillium longicatenatum TaxID=1561947 RepID=UPI002546FBBB|nr:uncharacterized protein N7484_002238 [Penicillium longicatenatum]KAJ5658589.1 hypothetical protein N7484_002238 [Penicillium longicatenatum]